MRSLITSGPLARHLPDRRARHEPDAHTALPQVPRRARPSGARHVFALSVRLPVLAAGCYVVWSRGIDAAGNVEHKNPKRNLRRFRILAKPKARTPV